MADLVAEIIDGRETLICEAGTGTGKTFAYLVPAVLSGHRVIVSTATKTLQDQLFRNDLPLVLRALAADTSVALLKGRANYACLERLENAHGDPLLGPRELADLRRIEAWARGSASGDVSEVTAVPEDSPLWPYVTSTVDNCLGSTCPHFDDCFVVRARREAAAADLVVVNHHLLFADMALREEGFAEILPTAQVVVIDEAHQLPELASNSFGQAVSSRQLRELGRDTAAALEGEAPDMPSLRVAVAGLDRAVAVASSAFALHSGRQDRELIGRAPGLAAALAALDAALTTLARNLAAAAERGPRLSHCQRRVEDLAARLAAYRAADSDDWVQWFEATPRGFVLHATPLSVAELFQARIQQYSAAWIFCSATLAVDGDFEHFRRELGLATARVAIWDSPFDFARQTLLYLPKIALAPAAAGYLDAIVEVAEPVITASRGRAFCLFTSYRALEHCAARLRERLPYPVLVQGDAPRAALLEDFKRLGNAVLLGTATFWEGVDVRGEALSCVIIDKLPFSPPDDPITRARIRRLEADGHNPFREYQIPEAVISLKQGVGRLIRDVTDRGVLVLCDPRLKTRGYGRIFLQSLPAMPVTRDLAEVERFFAP